MKRKTIKIISVKLIFAFVLLFNFKSWSQNFPSVTITSPATNSTFTEPATITINATASVIGGTVTNVEFFSGPNSLGIDSTAPYSFVWSNVPAGSYLITARATSDAGYRTNSPTIAIVVNASTGNQSPTVSITSPANNSSYSAPASITINANATDPDGTVSSVSFYNGTTLLSTDATSPYSYTWTNVASGSYTITARATDNIGAITTSTPITVAVNATSNIAPTVSITSPSNNTSFTAPASITINANASDADGTVSVVSFYNGSTLLGTDVSSPYSFVWSNVVAGTYTLTASATDNAGAVTTSSAITIVINPATTTTGVTIQCETACTADGALNETANAGFTGTGYVNTDDVLGASATWAVNSQTAQTINMDIRYAHNTSTGRPMSLSVNGVMQVSNIPFPATGSPSTWVTTTVQINLASGANIIKMVSLANIGSPYLDAFTFESSTVSAGTCPATSASVTIQGETACTVVGTLNETANAGYRGTGYLNTTNVLGAYATWSVNSQTAQTINLGIRYATATTTGRPMSLSVNGNTQIANIPFPYSGGLTSWVVTNVQISLSAGKNVIRMEAITDIGSPYLDEFTFGSSTVSASTCNVLPTITISSPTNNSSFTAPATITLNANASDADGTISTVSFYNGSTLIGTDATSPYIFVWTNVAAGTYTITAKATDNNGETTTSTPISIVVKSAANIPPTVSITSPANNTSYTAPASITITATAADADGTVSSVSFYNGSTLLGTDATAPYTFTWTNVAAGTNTITARATDNSGAITTSLPITIVVNPAANVLPTITITAPANNATYTAPANITLNATASDADGTVSSVAFYNGTTLLGTDLTAPYSFSWANVAAGTYTITARATDNSGGVTISSSVTVVVNSPANIAPTISITAPLNNAVFTAPASVTINATATDVDGTVSSVSFYNGSVLLGTDASAPYSFTWTNVAAGTYNITAKATDNSGAVTTSAAVTIIVNQPITTVTIQAETACQVDGNSNENSNGGFTGTGYVNTNDLTGASATWAINSSVAQTVNLDIRYAHNTTTGRPMSLKVNGIVQVATIPFPSSGGSSTWVTTSVQITLVAGNNSLQMVSLSADGSPYIDALTFGSSNISAGVCGTVDCNGVIGGTAVKDNCGNCVKGNTGLTPCTATTIEAETACFVDGVLSENVNSGFNGTGYVNTDDVLGASVNWIVNSASSQSITLGIRYAHTTTTGRPMALKVNGLTQVANIDFPSTGSKTTWVTVNVPITLTAGTNTLQLVSLANIGSPYIDQLIYSGSVTAGNCSSYATIQAEVACSVNGIFNESVNSGYTGTGYLYTNSQFGANAVWSVNSPNAQSTSLGIRYAHNTASGKDMSLSVNGTTQPVSFPSTGSLTEWITAYVQVNLVAGVNSIELVALTTSGSPNIDALIFGPTGVTIGACPGGNPGSGNCSVVAIPQASQWTVGNDWTDQYSGSGVSNTTDAMKITQRQWGMNKLWITQTGLPLAIESGKTYTIQFDFQNDSLSPVNSIDVGFATKNNWNGPTLAQSSVNVAVSSNGSYQTRTVTITSNVNATVLLTLGLNWPTQLTKQSNIYLKNVSVCSPAPALLANSPLAAQSITGPNPSSASFTLTAIEGIQSLYLINDKGIVVYSGGTLGATESVIFGEQLQSGLYVLIIQYADGTTESRKLQKVQ